jgi:hypothetical protein
MLNLLGVFFLKFKNSLEEDLYESADAIDLAGGETGEALRALRAIGHVCGQQQVGRPGHAHSHVQPARTAVAAWHSRSQVHAHLTHRKLKLSLYFILIGGSR